jgi:hypothetical protein
MPLRRSVSRWGTVTRWGTVARWATVARWWTVARWRAVRRGRSCVLSCRHGQEDLFEIDVLVGRPEHRETRFARYAGDELAVTTRDT